MGRTAKVTKNGIEESRIRLGRSPFYGGDYSDTTLECRPPLMNRETKDDKNAKVEHPPHYKNHPSGIECIEITEHLNFCLGNAIKYIWRSGLKGSEIEDLKKAQWYIKREIERLAGE